MVGRKMHPKKTMAMKWISFSPTEDVTPTKSNCLVVFHQPI